MMSDLLNEYKAYYQLRVDKYADNPNYINSYNAEKNLFDAINSCSTLEEFKTKIGNLSNESAIALVKDEAKIEFDFYNKYEEHIRKKAPEEILNKIDAIENVQDLISMTVDVQNKNSIEVSMDESNRQLLYDWMLLDEYEIYKNAVVPDKYKSDMLETAEKSKKALIKNVTDLEENNDKWESGWKINPELALEIRHSRWFPYHQEIIDEQTEKYKSIINR